MKKVLLSWSSGKDSAWVLHQLQQDPAIEVVALVTSFNQEARRVAMHAERRELVEAQAEAAGLPLWAVDLPWPCTNAGYEERMSALWQRAVKEGIQAVAFGDLFLEDIRAYRLRQLAPYPLEPLFPAWGIPTAKLARDMISSGIRARLTCVDPRQIPRELAGREFDAALLNDLPATADPCGENGEFHTFVHEAPCFQHPIPTTPGITVERDGFLFFDLTP